MRRMRPQIAFLQKGLFTSSVFWPIKFHADTFLQKTTICFLMTSWQPELKGIPFPSNFLFKLMSIFLQMVYRMFPYSSKLLAIKSCFCGHFMKNYPICSFFTYIRNFCKTPTHTMCTSVVHYPFLFKFELVIVWTQGIRVFSCGRKFCLLLRNNIEQTFSNL